VCPPVPAAARYDDVRLLACVPPATGVASFFLYLPAERHRVNFGGLYEAANNVYGGGDE
jgi:hypothetical protein